MEEIYRKADAVLIWLGKSDDSYPSKLGFSLVNELCDLARDDLLYSPQYEDSWKSLAKLMSNPWFHRRWVIQELAFAKKAFLHCGAYSVPWDNFADAVATLKYDQIRKSLRNTVFNLGDGDELHQLETRGRGPKVLIETIEGMFRKDKDEIIDYRMTLESLIFTLMDFEASDPRDVFYAVLSLARDSPRQSFDASEVHMDGLRMSPKHNFKPDYEKDLMEVCQDFVTYCFLASSNSLDIICRHWAPVPQKLTESRYENFPGEIASDQKNWVTKRPLASWMPSINDGPFGSPQDAWMGRKHGDSLVGSPQRQYYSASGSMNAKVRFGTIKKEFELSGAKKPEELLKDRSAGIFYRALPQGTLSATGLQVDNIHELSWRCEHGIIMAQSLRIGGIDPDTDEHISTVPDELWRTMVADRGPDGIYAPRWYRRACLRVIERRNGIGDINTTKLIEQERNSIVIDFLSRVRDVVWNRRFFRSQHERRLGLAPPNAQTGDIICILFGCSVPVILRPVENRQHILIGECYFHGMMEGEAISRRSKESLNCQTQNFILR
jgi:hypothetical protein